MQCFGQLVAITQAGPRSIRSNFALEETSGLNKEVDSVRAYMYLLATHERQFELVNEMQSIAPTAVIQEKAILVRKIQSRLFIISNNTERYTTSTMAMRILRIHG